MALPTGFIGTIEEDEEIDVESEDTSSDEEAVKPKKWNKQKKKGCEDFSKGFEFTEKSWDEKNWMPDLGHSIMQKGNVSSTLEQKIAKIRKERKKLQKQEQAAKSQEAQKGKESEQNNNEDEAIASTTTKNDDDADDEEEEDDNGEDEDEKDGDVEEEDSDSDDEMEDLKFDQVKVNAASEKRVKRNQQKGDLEDLEDEATFFEEPPEVSEVNSFQDMNLSRPLLKAVSTMNFTTPTPIQAVTIPVALLGKDICACAATGTGKTAAFMLPVLERLLYKPREAAVTRVLTLVPTRELGVQVYNVTRQLCQFTSIECCLAVGGLDVKLQEAALRRSPDIVIATPGRLIDHLHNAPVFHVNDIEILILDEADRMLDEYFAEQMKEIIRLCSYHRQTMLFSATMTDEVRDLAAVSLRNPVKLFVNENTDVAYNLRQEFVRIRENREGDREAVVAALCCRTFHDHCMVFVQTKKQAHRLHILLGLIGLNVAELHGDMSQTQRLEALRKFKEEQVDILVATDLASRGLDIEGVKTVINFTMPNSAKHYVHRVGRTARAGKSGRSVSLAGEKERKMLKEIVKRARNPVKSRVVPQGVIQKYRDKIESMEKDVYKVLKLEQAERELRISELQVHKAQNMIDHHDEIMSRPKRTWFQSHKARMQEKESQRLDQSRNPKKGKDLKKEKRKREKATAEARVKFEIDKAQMFAHREAKRARKSTPEKFGKRSLSKDKTGKKKKQAGKSSFDKELTQTNRTAVRQYRAMANKGRREEERENKQMKGNKPMRGKGPTRGKGSMRGKGPTRGKGNAQTRNKRR
ncbi:probable ATP-dependent RNA helicase DDX27 [Amphiura filiformis]|uniref:probable ATP-dependent RNA helicase DDX27 n=1 Tax=Amphiura filiformis TaxID=82378 RepID=UPI003B226D96